MPGHPLGRPILGTKQSILAAGRDQVRRFYRKHYVAGNVVVVAAGNLRHEELLELVAEHMEPGAVRAEGPSAWNLRTAGNAPSPSGRSLVNKRKTEQAHICIGTSGLSRIDPDRFAFGVVNNALGGGMSSRLFQEVREKRGLAYSVYSYHAMYAEAGCSAPTPVPRPRARRRSSRSCGPSSRTWPTKASVPTSSSARRAT